ncbi:MAG: ankyrin repeat domain-containing protein, partial [bacterium]|nr:ankyrin repeat domain-containing protein [bacterium]
MSLKHTDLIKLAQILGYESVMDNGMCAGFSVMLSQAFLVQQEQKFFDRLALIESYKDEFYALKKQLDEIAKKITYKVTLNSFEKKLLEIPAFFDGVALSHRPYKYSKLFEGQFITQNHHERIYPFIASAELEKGAPVSVHASKNYIFNLAEAVIYFTALEYGLKESASIRPIWIRSNLHKIFVMYDNERKKWIYVDINRLGEELSNKYYFELNSAQLVKQLYRSFCCSEYSFIALNVTCISTSTNASDKSLFDFLDSIHLNVPKQTTRYSDAGVGLLYLACIFGDLQLVRKLTKQDGINLNSAIKKGTTPLYIACRNGHIEIVQELLKHPDINVNSALDTGATPLYIACQNGDAEIVKELLKRPDINVNCAINTGTTP